MAMACKPDSKVWQLGPREVLRLDGARGTTVRATRGTLWLTLENDPRDIVLVPGNAFTIDRGGLTLVEAQDDAVLCVDPRYIDARRSGAIRSGILAWIAAWLRTIGPAPWQRRPLPYF
jgi:hypothetical protein